MANIPIIKKETLVSKENQIPENINAYKDNLKNIQTLNEFTENFADHSVGFYCKYIRALDNSINLHYNTFVEVDKNG